MGIKDYFINYVLYPQTVALNQPGVIVNRGVKALGNTGKLRFQYYFENVFAGLQKQTYSELGREITDDLFYKIGKDYTTLGLYFGKLKIPPKILEPFIFKLIFMACKSAGFNIFGNCKISTDKIVLWGDCDHFFKISGNLSFFEGMASAIYSWINRKNIESYSIKNGKIIKLICEKNVPQRYVPDGTLRRFIKSYNELNFQQIDRSKKYASAQDLIQHKKIVFNEEMQSLYLGNLLYFGAFIYELTAYHYKKLNRLDILEKGLVKASESLAPKILEARISRKQLEEITKLLCAFGWGFPHYKIIDTNIVMTFVYPPYSDLGFEFYAYELNGYLNYIFGKKLKLEKIEKGISPPFMRFIYSL